MKCLEVLIYGRYGAEMHDELQNENPGEEKSE